MQWLESDCYGNASGRRPPRDTRVGNEGNRKSH